MSSQATQDQATQDAWAAGAWSFGSAVRTPAQASVAARWAFLEASKEAKEGSRFGPTYYATIASSAALDYYGGSVGDILARVAARLSDVPYTSSRWATVRGLSTLAAVVPAPAPTTTKRRTTPPAYTAPATTTKKKERGAASASAESPSDLMKQPWFWPAAVVGGASIIGILVLLLRPKG